MVIASQMPYGSEGTYPLTEVQADRFMFRTWSAYPHKDEEQRIVKEIDYIEEPEITAVTTLKEILTIQQAVKKTFVSDKVREYIVTLVDAVRQDPDVHTGPSPRASLSLYKGSRALAFLQERDYVIPDDVKRLVIPTFEHRIRVKPEAEMENITPKLVAERALKQVPVPTIQ
jgi:MoxR-like ATPase